MLMQERIVRVNIMPEWQTHELCVLCNFYYLRAVIIMDINI